MSQNKSVQKVLFVAKLICDISFNCCGKTICNIIPYNKHLFRGNKNFYITKTINKMVKIEFDFFNKIKLIWNVKLHSSWNKDFEP